MSLLPQHKKSPEELAKLRESLGISGQAPASDSLSAIVPLPPADPEGQGDSIPLEISSHQSETRPVYPASNVPESQVLAPIPVPELPLKQLRSLRRSDRNPAVPSGNDQQWSPENEAQALPVSSGVKISPLPRAVHSLKKSEQVPLSQIKAPAPDSGLPIHRHSPDEIREIRRQELLAIQKAVVGQASQKAHWIVVIPGYLFALAAIVACYYYQLGILITGGCLVVSFALAGFLLFRKPYSRHHAAFIGVMSLLIAIFSILYYFPQLRYGT
jgi:hypothetical protein